MEVISASPRPADCYGDGDRIGGARVLEQAMEIQFTDPDGVDPAERQAWDRLRSGAVARQLATEPRDACAKQPEG